MYRKPSRLTGTIIRMTDCICMAVSVFIAFFLRFGDDYVTQSGVNIGYTYALLCGVYLVVSVFVKEKKSIYARGYLDELIRVVIINATVMVVVIFVLYSFHLSHIYSRIVIALCIVISIITEYIAHIILKKLLPVIYLRSSGTRNALLVGSTDYIKEYISKDYQDDNKGVNVIGCFITNDSERIDGDPIRSINNDRGESIAVFEQADDIEEYCVQNPVDEIFICIDGADITKWNVLLNNLVDAGIAVHVEINAPEIKYAAGTIIEQCNGDYYITYTKKFLSTADIVLKRTMDIIGGMIGSIITVILYVFIAPAIKLTSKGPVMFTQDRVGKNGRIIRIAKFRSMVVDAEEMKAKLAKENEMDGMMFKMENDPRITTVGRFIRRTSIDEFPQFFSVLKGDMSLVGTRPPTLDEYEKYNLKQKSRLAFKPGITGLWQVSGRNNIKNFDDIVKLDNKYIREWSLLEDVKIIIKTVPAMLGGK